MKDDMEELRQLVENPQEEARVMEREGSAARQAGYMADGRGRKHVPENQMIE